MLCSFLHTCDEDKIIQTIELLNSEWHCSKAARRHFLDQSCDDLPTSVVLIDQHENQVIAHSRICRVIEDELTGYIESVVVAEKMRGKGYGKQIMNEVHQFAASRGLHRIVLRTTDKQAFYECLGYVKASPVTKRPNGAQVCVRFFLQPSLVPHLQCAALQTLGARRTSEESAKPASKQSPNAYYQSNPPKAPPPPPQFDRKKIQDFFDGVWLQKELEL